MHLHAAQRFLEDSSIPATIRHELKQPEHLGAFLLGNVAPDARVSGGLARGNTHFFEYTPPKIDPLAKIALFKQYPALQAAQGAQRALLAGYLAHLAMDIIWAEQMLFPHFYAREWASQPQRFVMLHVLLCYLDAQDYRQWDDRFGPALANAPSQHGLPFLPDNNLAVWQGLIAQQICEGCASQTLAVLGARIPIGEAGLRHYLNSPDLLQTDLWQHISPDLLPPLGEQMYAAMCQDIVEYMEGCP
jgi:hypothetical protein